MATKKLKYAQDFDGSYEWGSKHFPKLDGMNDFKELIKYLNQKDYKIKEENCNIENTDPPKYHLKGKNIEITIKNHHWSDGTDGGKSSMGVECDVTISPRKSHMQSPEILVSEFNKVEKTLEEYFTKA